MKMPCCGDRCLLSPVCCSKQGTWKRALQSYPRAHRLVTPKTTYDYAATDVMSACARQQDITSGAAPMPNSQRQTYSCSRPLHCAVVSQRSDAESQRQQRCSNTIKEHEDSQS